MLGSILTPVASFLETAFTTAIVPIFEIVAMITAATLIIKFLFNHVREGGEYHEGDE